MLRVSRVQCSIALWHRSDLIWVNILRVRLQAISATVAGKTVSFYRASSFSDAALLRFSLSYLGLAKRGR